MELESALSFVRDDALRATAAVPVGLLVALVGWLWMKARGSEVHWAENGVLVGVTAAILLLTIPESGGNGGVELVPLAPLFERPAAALLDALANLAIFVPFGAAVKWRFQRLSVGQITVMGLAFSTSIEAIQYMGDLGRTASGSDVLWNGVGTWLGARFVVR